MHVVEDEATKWIAQGEGSTMGSEKTTIRGYVCDFDYYKSKVWAQLDALWARFNIHAAITMRAFTLGELFFGAKENGNKIPFPVATLKCGVNLPIIPFVRQFLSVLPFHPLQAFPTFWENCLALFIMWHRAQKRNPTMAELQVYFGLKSPSK